MTQPVQLGRLLTGTITALLCFSTSCARTTADPWNLEQARYEAKLRQLYPPGTTRKEILDRSELNRNPERFSLPTPNEINDPFLAKALLDLKKHETSPATYDVLFEMETLEASYYNAWLLFYSDYVFYDDSEKVVKTYRKYLGCD